MRCFYSLLIFILGTLLLNAANSNTQITYVPSVNDQALIDWLGQALDDFKGARLVFEELNPIEHNGPRSKP